MNNVETGTALVPITTDQYIEQQLQTFPEPEAAIAKYKAKADELVIADLHDTKGYKAVDELRKEAKRKRITVDKYRKELLEVPKLFTKKVNERANHLIGLLEEVEAICETKQKPIDDERERIKREAEEAEQKRLAEKERIRREQQEHQQLIAKREDALLRGGFLASLEEYLYKAGNGKEFRVAKEDVHNWNDECWKTFVQEIRTFKAENNPAPADQPATELPAQAPVLPAQPAAPSSYASPAAAYQTASATVSGVQLPRVGAGVQSRIDDSLSPEYVAGFNAAKALVVAELFKPEVKHDRQGWIDFIKALKPQAIR